MSDPERTRADIAKTGLALFPGEYELERKPNVSQEILIARHSEDIVKKLNEGMTINAIAKELSTSHKTLERATRQIGRWVFWPWPRGFRGPYPPHRHTEPPRGGARDWPKHGERNRDEG